MSVQKKMSMIECLEGRQLYSASPAVDAEAAALAAGAGKVSMQDFHFVMRHNSGSPTLAADTTEVQGISFTQKVTKSTPQLRIKLTDILVSGKTASDPAAAGEATVQDFAFTQKVNKSSPKL